MPSDERIAVALSALRPRVAAFRFAISGALDRARSALASESGPGQARNTLGEFGGRLIDAERFSLISLGAGPLDAASRAAVGRAADLLACLLRAGDDEFVVDVAPGTSLAAVIRARLATLGSLFGAAALIELARRGTFDSTQSESLLDEFPFEKWSAAERRFAPPLVIRVDGGDLDAFALAPLIDGWMRLILLVDGPSSAAPLARLVSPGAFVAQSGDMKILERIAEFDGPAVIAMMNGPEARFVHDPRAGSTFLRRVEVSHMPDAQSRRAPGPRSAWQQRDDLAHLKALVEQPVLPAISAEALAPATAGPGIDPVERLTAWLLDQSGLPAERGYAA